MADIFWRIPGSVVDDFEELLEEFPECAEQSALLQAADVLPLTHVCRRWRQIAMDMRVLWTTVDDRKRLPFEIHVQRSRGLPLYVIIDGKPTKNILSGLRKHRDSIRQLHWVAARCFGYDFRTDLELPLPNLQTATLFGTKTYKDEKLNLFGNAGTSSLQRLSFGSVHWLPTNHFPHLTQLHLSLWTGNPYPSVFLAFLRRCPNLVDVFITSLFADEPELIPDPDTDFVELPRLRRLSLKGFARNEIVHVLSHIRAPSDTALAVLEGFLYPDESMDIGDEDARVISRFSSISLCTTAVIRMDHAGTYSMAFLRQTAGVYFENLLAESRSISLPLPLGQVQEMWLVDDPMVPPGSHSQAALNTDVFRRMSAVRRLVITVGFAHAVYLAVRALDEDQRPSITSFEILVNTPDLPGHFSTCIMSLIEMGVPHPMITIPTGLPSARQRVKDMDTIDSTKCITCEQLPIPALPKVCTEHSDFQPSWKSLVAPVCKLGDGMMVSNRI